MPVWNTPNIYESKVSELESLGLISTATLLLLLATAQYLLKFDKLYSLALPSCILVFIFVEILKK